MQPILFKIGNLSFYSQGVSILVGIVIGFLVVYFFSKKHELYNAFLFDNIIYTVLAGIIGARIAYIVLYQSQFSNLKELIFIWEGGLVSYGGFLLGGLTFFILLKIQKQPVLKWFDALAIGFPLGLFFGRLGDIMAGDYYNSDKFTNIQSLSKGIPLPLFEALLCLVIFFLLAIMSLKIKKINSGLIFFIMVLIYSGGRFIIDFWRNEKLVIWNLSFGQVFGLIIFILSLIAIILLRSVKKEGEYYEPVN